MVDKEDVFLKIKVKHNGISEEFRSENLPTLDELKSKIMGYFSIPDIKKYMHFSYKNKEGQNNIIQKAEDLIKNSNTSQEDKEYYIEIDLSIDDELNKIIQFMNSAQFNSNNNNKIVSDNKCQNLDEKEKMNESEMKINEEDKKLKIKEFQEQKNEIKKRRENIKEMINKLYKNFENLVKLKNDWKIYFLNEINNKINDIIPIIESNFLKVLNNKEIKFDEIIKTTSEDIINKLMQNIENKENNIIDIFKKQNDEDERIHKININYEEIRKDIDKIKNEIKNKNNIKNDSKELQSNINIKELQNKNQNNDNGYYEEVKKNKRKIIVRLKHHSDITDNNSLLKNFYQKKNSNNKIENELYIVLEEILFNDLKDLSTEETKNIRDLYYKLKRLKIDPLSFVDNYLNSNISIFNNDIIKKNEKEEKFRILISIFKSLEKYYKKDNLKEEKTKRNKHTSSKKSTNNYNKRNIIKKDN